MRFCENCGGTLGPQAVFCVSCGAAVTAKAAPRPAASSPAVLSPLAATAVASAPNVASPGVLGPVSPRQYRPRKYPPPSPGFGKRRSRGKTGLLLLVLAGVAVLGLFRFDVLGGEAKKAEPKPASVSAVVPGAEQPGQPATSGSGLVADPAVVPPADVESSLQGVVEKAQEVTGSASTP